MKATGNPIVDLTFQFSLRVLDFTDKLEQMKKYPIAKQLTKSGTSVGANVREAQSAESRRDFIHKLKISEKELEETEYWLDLCKYSDVLPDPGDLAIKAAEIKKVLGKIISTAVRNEKGAR
jgi:four helix bundle protein